MATKTIGNTTYIDCTAIAKSIGDTERQNAVLAHRNDVDNGEADSIYFGFTVSDMGEDDASLNDETYSTYSDDLETIVF